MSIKLWQKIKRKAQRFRKESAVVITNDDDLIYTAKIELFLDKVHPQVEDYLSRVAVLFPHVISHKKPTITMIDHNKILIEADLIGDRSGAYRQFLEQHLTKI